MQPGTLHLDVVRGAAFEKVLQLKTDGVPVDLTGWTPIAGAIRTDDTTVRFELGAQLFVATQGKIKLRLTTSETKILELGEFDWDLYLEDPSGEVWGPYVVGRISTRDARAELS